jgi:hypothetical protein
VNQLCVVVTTRQAGLDAGPVDGPQLKARVVEKLAAAGIQHVESQTGPVPRLLVRIEGTAVPEGGKYVSRVQISLIRLVTLSHRPDFQIQAEVWQGRPATEVVAKEDAAQAITTTVLAQAEAFLAAHQAARSLRPIAPAAKQAVSGASPPGQMQSSPQDLQAIPQYPYISSKSSMVFHKPDCRWAQNIAAGNLVGYNSRDEAVQAGKRPCKSCTP